MKAKWTRATVVAFTFGFLGVLAISPRSASTQNGQDPAAQQAAADANAAANQAAASAAKAQASVQQQQRQAQDIQTQAAQAKQDNQGMGGCCGNNSSSN